MGKWLLGDWLQTELALLFWWSCFSFEGFVVYYGLRLWFWRACVVVNHWIRSRLSLSTVRWVSSSLESIPFQVQLRNRREFHLQLLIQTSCDGRLRRLDPNYGALGPWSPLRPLSCTFDVSLWCVLSVRADSSTLASRIYCSRCWSFTFRQLIWRFGLVLQLPSGCQASCWSCRFLRIQSLPLWRAACRAEPLLRWMNLYQTTWFAAIISSSVPGCSRLQRAIILRFLLNFCTVIIGIPFDPDLFGAIGLGQRALLYNFWINRAKLLPQTALLDLEFKFLFPNRRHLIRFDFDMILQ